MSDTRGAWVVVAHVIRPEEAAEVAYALSLRGMEARAVAIPRSKARTRRWGVEVPPHDEARASEALPFIWEAMRDPTVVFAPRRCAFCEYSLTGLPSGALCPECGNDPWGEEARRRALASGL